MKFAQAIETALADVPSLDDDRIIRRFRNVIDNVLRTNFWQPDAKGAAKPYIAIKLDSEKLEETLPHDLRTVVSEPIDDGRMVSLDTHSAHVSMRLVLHDAPRAGLFPAVCLVSFLGTARQREHFLQAGDEDIRFAVTFQQSVDRLALQKLLMRIG